MFDTFQIEQHIAEQPAQHNAIIGSLTSAEHLLRVQVWLLNQSEIRKTILCTPNKQTPLHEMVKEMIKKNDLLVEQIYAKIDKIRINAHNLATINRLGAK